MKKNRLLLLLFFVLPTLQATAQNFIGFKAGVSYSNTYLPFNLMSEDLVQRSYLPGLQLGIPIQIKVNELLTIQPEIIIATEGSFLNVFRAEEQRIYNNALVYIKMPLLAKTTLWKKKNYQVHALLGVTPAYAIDIKSISYPQGFRTITIREEPISFETSTVKRFDLALSAGLDIQKTIAKGIKMVLETRYNLGLYDIEKLAERTSFTESFYLTIGLLMPIKRKKIKKEPI